MNLKYYAIKLILSLHSIYLFLFFRVFCQKRIDDYNIKRCTEIFYEISWKFWWPWSSNYLYLIDKLQILNKICLGKLNFRRMHQFLKCLKYSYSYNIFNYTRRLKDNDIFCLQRLFTTDRMLFGTINIIGFFAEKEEIMNSSCCSKHIRQIWCV